MLCRELKLFTEAVVAIDGSKFKAVNNRERNYTPGKIERRERELRRASSVTSMHWRLRIGPSPRRYRPRPSACRARFRKCANACRNCKP
jgi:hypothetical protein